MARLVLSLLAQSDQTKMARDLASAAGERVAAKYVALLYRLYLRLSDHPESGW